MTDDDPSSSDRRGLFGRLTDAVVSPIVGAVDVDSVVAQIDMQALLDEVDIDALIQRVDVQALIDRVDIDVLIQKVDIDALIQRVDIQALIDRVDIDALVQRVDIGALIDRVDIQSLIARLDIDALVQRVDIGALIDRVDIQALIDRVDIDALVQRVDIAALIDRVDVQALIEKVDIDALVQRLDVDALIGRVDIQALIGRVDINKVVQTVDMNALMERTELGAIIARSTTGMFGQLLDVARGVVIVIDLVIHRVVGRIIRPRGENRPGVPGDLGDVVDTTRMANADRAVALQGHFAGALSRLFGFLGDQFATGALFAAGQFLFSLAVSVVTGYTWVPADHRAVTAAAYVVWAFAYTVVPLAVLGRTPGMAVVGLVVRRANGSPIRTRDAVIRTVILPVSFAVFGLGLLIGLLRRDRRQLQDLIAGTAVVYAWDASLAALRESAPQT